MSNGAVLLIPAEAIFNFIFTFTDRDKITVSELKSFCGSMIRVFATDGFYSDYILRMSKIDVLNYLEDNHNIIRFQDTFLKTGDYVYNYSWFDYDCYGSLTNALFTAKKETFLD